MSIAVSLYGALVLLGPAEAKGNPLASLNEHYEETTMEIHREQRKRDLERIIAEKRKQEEEAEARRKALEARRKAEASAARAKAQREAEARRQAEREAEASADNGRPAVHLSDSSDDGSGGDSGVHVGSQGIAVEATYYTAFCDTGCTGITATGIDVSGGIMHNGLRIIAVDPAVIPLGSVVEVNAGGATFKALAGDTGGAIKGNRIDILVATKNEARQLGRTSATVRILNGE